MNKNKIIFFGLNDYGESTLKYLLQHSMNISCVVIPIENRTKDFESICENKKIKLIRVQKDWTEVQAELQSSKPDILVISSFSKILPREIIHYPRLGSLNVHPSLLPKYRGAHPIHWALLNDEKTTGVTIHTVEEKVDTGKILAQKEIPILNTDDINSLIAKTAKIGAELLLETLLVLFSTTKTLNAHVQDEDIATFAPKRRPEDGKIEWKSDTRNIFNLIRSLKSPYPNAFSFTSSNEKIEFEESFISKTPGTVLAKIQDHYLISTGDGVLLIKTKNDLHIGEILK